MPRAIKFELDGLCGGGIGLYVRVCLFTSEACVLCLSKKSRPDFNNNNEEMALQGMILVPPEMWENRSYAPPPTVKNTLNSKDHSYNKWTQVRFHQDPYFKSEKQKRKPIPIPIL